MAGKVRVPVVGLRDPRVLGGVLAVGLLSAAFAGPAAAQTGCAPAYTCNASSATPLPSVPVVVASPNGTNQTTSDVLSRPAATDGTSALPAVVVAIGALVLILTLFSLARGRISGAPPVPRRTAPAHQTRVRQPAPSKPAEGQPARRRAVPTGVAASRWDIGAVERAASGHNHPA